MSCNAVRTKQKHTRAKRLAAKPLEAQGMCHTVHSSCTLHCYKIIIAFNLVLKTSKNACKYKICSSLNCISGLNKNHWDYSKLQVVIWKTIPANCETPLCLASLYSLILGEQNDLFLVWFVLGVETFVCHKWHPGSWKNHPSSLSFPAKVTGSCPVVRARIHLDVSPVHTCETI